MRSRSRSGSCPAAENAEQPRRATRSSIHADGGLHWPPLAVEGALLKVAGQVLFASRGYSERQNYTQIQNLFRLQLSRKLGRLRKKLQSAQQADRFELTAGLQAKIDEVSAFLRNDWRRVTTQLIRQKVNLMAVMVSLSPLQQCINALNIWATAACSLERSVVRRKSSKQNPARSL